MNLAEPLATTVTVALIVLSLAMLLTFVRLVLGPTLPDRVIALDIMATQAVGIIAVYDIVTHEPIFLRVATVVALITFLGTTAFAHYVERRGAQWGPN
jgi:multicomponent Na+:H+ antiporter subunit F